MWQMFCFPKRKHVKPSETLTKKFGPIDYPWLEHIVCPEDSIVTFTKYRNGPPTKRNRENIRRVSRIWQKLTFVCVHSMQFCIYFLLFWKKKKLFFVFEMKLGSNRSHFTWNTVHFSVDSKFPLSINSFLTEKKRHFTLSAHEHVESEIKTADMISVTKFLLIAESLFESFIRRTFFRRITKRATTIYVQIVVVLVISPKMIKIEMIALSVRLLLNFILVRVYNAVIIIIK